MTRIATTATLLLLLGAASPVAGQTPGETGDPPPAWPADDAHAAEHPPHPRSPVVFCPDGVELMSAGLNDPLQDLARSAELWGASALRSRTMRRPSSELRLRVCAGAPADRPAALTAAGPTPRSEPPVAHMLPVGITMQHNSGYPRGGNAGPRWAGRGISTDVNAGFAVRWGPLTAVLAPIVAFHENRAFETVEVRRSGTSEFAYPWHANIDWPQRFGDESFTTVHPGQSVVRLDHRGFAAGFSTENLWWGPAIRNPVIMSNNAPGVPHFFIGTGRPHDIWIGNLELEAVWGRLSTSDYHRLEPPDETVLFSGIVLTLEPRGLPGLYLGAARSYLENFPPGEFNLWEQITRPYTRMTENIRSDPRFGNSQLGSIFARWALPESGFEVYLEWAREDHWDSRVHLMNEPEHSRGYTAGFQKVRPIGDAGRALRMQGEVTYLGTTSSVAAGSAGVTFYRHSRVRQGYTHRGQILGAWIGPGADAQFIGFDLLDPRGRAGFYLERIRYDSDAYRIRFAPAYDFRRHDVELTAGLRGAWAVSAFTINSDLSFSRRHNRNFLRLDGMTWDKEIDTNWGLQLGLSWRPVLRWSPAPPTAADPP